MLHTVQAEIDTQGNVRLLERVRLKKARRALVTILEDDASPDEVTTLSEHALAKDWLRPEEDAAWAHLQKVR